jgi:hypothetical protein
MGAALTSWFVSTAPWRWPFSSNATSLPALLEHPPFAPVVSRQRVHLSAGRAKVDGTVNDRDRSDIGLGGVVPPPLGHARCRNCLAGRLSGMTGTVLKLHHAADFLFAFGRVVRWLPRTASDRTCAD